MRTPNNTIVCSADHFFEQDGVYKFDPTKLPAAHASCMKDFITAVQNAVPGKCMVLIMRGVPGCGKSTYIKKHFSDTTMQLIVVDNTNITLFEVAPYMVIATAYGLQAMIITLQCDPVVAAARNQHGVPLDAVQRMAERMTTSTNTEMWPPWWSRVEEQAEI